MSSLTLLTGCGAPTATAPSKTSTAEASSNPVANSGADAGAKAPNSSSFDSPIDAHVRLATVEVPITTDPPSNPPRSGALQPPTSVPERVKIRFAPAPENSIADNKPATASKETPFELASAVKEEAKNNSAKNPDESTEETQPPSSVVSTDVRSNATSDVLKIGEIQGSSKPPSVATDAERNQVIAPNWPKPWVAFFITGQQHGYLEPCGCTGLENQKGGLNRRDTLLQEINERGWSVVPLDAGSQVRDVGRQNSIKFGRSVEALKEMKYRAVAPGWEDLNLSATDLYYAFVLDGDKTKNPFLAANVQVLDPDAMETERIIEIHGNKIGITAVLGDEWTKKVQNDDVTIAPMTESVKKSFKKIANCKYKILIAHATMEESEQLARSVPGFDLVITAGGYGEPTDRPQPIQGTKSVMVQVGVKGMHAGLLALYDDAANPVRYQRIALSSQFQDSKRMMELFKKYQNELKVNGLEGLGIRPINHSTQREFVGSDKCGECHSKAFAIWKKTGHALSTDHLINPPERSEVERHFDPECLSCHVTGWNPQQFFPYRTGYLSVEATPHMMQNGCENCHGPGASHVKAQEDSNSDKDLLIRLQEEMRLPFAEARDKCLECHDLDNSPNFHHGDNAFQEYWDKIKHYGKD